MHKLCWVWTRVQSESVLQRRMAAALLAERAKENLAVLGAPHREGPLLFVDGARGRGRALSQWFGRSTLELLFKS